MATELLQIQAFTLKNLTNGAHYQFIKNVCDRAQQEGAITSIGTANLALEALKSALIQEDKNLMLSQKSMITDRIKTGDQLRDDLYQGYKDAVFCFRHHPDAAFAEAATQLSQHLKDYAISPRMQLDRETGLISNLTHDLEVTKKTLVEKLGLTVIVSELAKANAKVAELIDSRTEEHAGEVAGALKQARTESDEAYNYFARLVNAFALTSNPDQFRKFINYMNELVKHYREQAMPKKKDDKPADKPADDKPADKPEDTPTPDASASDTPDGPNKPPRP